MCYFEQYIIYYIMCTLTLYCCFNCTVCSCCCHFIHFFHISTSICQTNLHSLCDRVKIKSGQVIQLENQTGGRETLWLFESNTKHPNALSSAIEVLRKKNAEDFSHRVRAQRPIQQIVQQCYLLQYMFFPYVPPGLQSQAQE